MAEANGKINTSKKSRGQLKRLKQKAKAKIAPEPLPEIVEVEIVPDEIKVEDLGYAEEEYKREEVEDNPAQAAFAEIFAKFQLPDEQEGSSSNIIDGKGEIIYSDDEMPSDNSDAEEPEVEISKRKQRKASRLSVAELKRLVKKPEVVEWVDVSATDPKLLVGLKSLRNSVPIPVHWSQKRDYLQGKRGVEKPAFQLPSFIADTGIATQRDAIAEKESGQSLKAKSRERVQPKMGKIDIDYQKLHDAFFKYQVKPTMTLFGEIYYEGKEFETSLKQKKPGDLSSALSEALSIPPLAPPPWLISMQRYGPPPSYPNLKIMGLNSPLPDGAAWGFHPGGWGKPPLDDFGRPLYGDIYGSQPKFSTVTIAGEPMDKIVWGELEPEEEESEEEDESDEEEEQSIPATGMETPSGLATPSGLLSTVSTVAGGLETPDFIDLRKRREETEEDSGPKSLYTVIPEKEVTMRGFMGSDRAYDVTGFTQQTPTVLGKEDGRKRKAGGVEIALDSSELEGLSEADLRAKFDAAGRKGTHEDFSDFVGKEVAKRRKTAEGKKDKGRNEEKEKFKF